MVKYFLAKAGKTRYHVRLFESKEKKKPHPVDGILLYRAPLQGFCSK